MLQNRNGELNCISCGETVLYDRAVVERNTETIVGGFCNSCEKPRFGAVLVAGEWELSSKCVLCDQRGEYALPIHRMNLRQVAGVEIIEEGYALCVETPYLCSDHLQFISSEEERPRATEPILNDE